MWANIRQGVVVNLALIERIETNDDGIVGFYADGRQVVLASVEDAPDKKSKLSLYDRRLRAILNDGIGIADLVPEAPPPQERQVEERVEKPFYVPDR
jgi:hypothetical protein